MALLHEKPLIKNKDISIHIFRHTGLSHLKTETLNLIDSFGTPGIETPFKEIF